MLLLAIAILFYIKVSNKKQPPITEQKWRTLVMEYTVRRVLLIVLSGIISVTTKLRTQSRWKVQKTKDKSKSTFTHEFETVELKCYKTKTSSSSLSMFGG
jgi:hypothetical protein